MTATTRFPLFAYLFASCVGLLGLAALWYGLGRPVQLADAARPQQKLQCASYTPFDKHQSPFDQPLRISEARMDADLTLLGKTFTCLRTYSVSGLEALPALARKHGLKLMLGAWVSRDAQATAVEVNELIDAANRYPDVVEAVIVGNESLLRKEVTPQQLVALIEQVKSRVEQPVTYADVWEFWLKHPEVAPAVDFLTIHLLPYWEDDPAGIDQALAKVSEVRELFGRQFAPKDILIGETGWPSEGRQRRTALPSRVNQAKFMRGFIKLANQHGWRYNLIEAFDQPWKRVSEGAAGGYWGLYDADRGDKSILAGAVSNLPQWRFWLLGCVLIWLAALTVAGAPRTRRDALGMPLIAALGTACIGLTGELAWTTSRYPGEWLWAAALLILNGLVLGHGLLALSARRGWRNRLFIWLEARAGWWLFAAGFAGAAMMLALVVDARYRSFPSATLLLPALVYLARPVRAPRREVILLALLIGAGIVPQLVQEGLGNRQAIGWALTSALLLAALWRSLRQRTQSV
nr:beta (1-6) glucans synthase [uncultured Pseudomonas sp.]